MTSRNGRAVVLSNPVAGRGDAALATARAVARLHQLGLEVEHIAGVDREHALELAHDAVASRPEMFLAAGGDGGVSVALQAIAGTGVPLGVIPTGTGNDTARALGLPLDDPERAADIAAAGRTRTVDLGLATLDDGTERYFFGVSGADYAAEVLTVADRLPRGWGAAPTYGVSAVAASAWLRARPFALHTDDGRDLSGEYYIAAVGNTRTYGGGMAICPSADPSDGMLDLTLIRRVRVPHLHLAGMLRDALRGGVTPDESVSFHRVRSLRMESPGRTLFADGDTVGPLPATLTCVPRAAEFIVP